MKSVRFAVVVLGFLMAVLPAQASIIDFENLSTGATTQSYGPTLTSGGFFFENQFPGFYSWGTAGAGYTGSVAIFAGTASPLRMSKSGGGAFSVNSIDLADAYLGNGSQSITFTGTRADNSTVVESIALTTPSSLATYAFAGMTNIVKLEWSQGSSPKHQFDNINVASPVPEPFTMGLAGLALAAAARRRLRKSA